MEDRVPLLDLVQLDSLCTRDNHDVLSLDRSRENSAGDRRHENVWLGLHLQVDGDGGLVREHSPEVSQCGWVDGWWGDGGAHDTFAGVDGVDEQKGGRGGGPEVVEGGGCGDKEGTKLTRGVRLKELGPDTSRAGLCGGGKARIRRGLHASPLEAACQ